MRARGWRRHRFVMSAIQRTPFDAVMVRVRSLIPQSGALRQPAGFGCRVVIIYPYATSGCGPGAGLPPGREAGGNPLDFIRQVC